MFDCGILELFTRFQDLLNKIYIKHRDYDDMSIDKSKARFIAEEINRIAEELPVFRLIFLN